MYLVKSKLKKILSNLGLGKKNIVSKVHEENFALHQDYPTTLDSELSEYALKVAKRIRNSECKPAIIIHGTMQRTGTVYVGELIRLHPDIYAYPKEIWEIPFLRFIDVILTFQDKFFSAYKQNIGKIGKYDFLPIFGAAFIDYLYSEVPEGKQMLLKIPSVKNLNYFFGVFPYENLLLLMRDGRDVVSSTIKTWPQRDFTEVSQQWKDNAQIALNFDHHYLQKEGYLFSKYEDIINNPIDFIQEACNKFGLDSEKFPYEKIEELPVRGSSSASVNQQGKVSWNPVEKSENFKPTQRWDSWSEPQKNTFKKIAGEMLIKLGYTENLNW